MITGLFVLALACPAVSAGDARFDPPADTVLMARIEALPENTWLKLPPFKVTGGLDWLSPRADERRRGPFGRSYCNHAYWAPERKRALFCGGGHNVKPINDVWEYDLAANAWICLRGADPGFSRNEDWFRKNAMLKFGIPATKTGAPVRMHHQWDQVTYDESRKLLLYVDSMPRSLTYAVKLGQEGNPLEKALGMTHEEFSKALGPDGIYAWGFDAEKRKFTHAEFVVNWKRPGNTVGGRQESGMLEYLRDKETTWFCGWGGEMVRDPESETWKAIQGSPRSYGAVGAYDHHTQTLISVLGGKTRLRKLKEKRWMTAIENGPARGNDASCTVHYDPLSRKFILFTSATKPNLWLFDTAAREWKDPKPAGDVPTSVAGHRMLIYFDEARNVLVYYDSSSVWVYRGKK